MEILELTLGIRKESNDRVARHVRSCSGCQLHVDSIRRTLGEIAAFGHQPIASVGKCLDEAALAELVEGRSLPELAQPRLEHVAGCTSCRGGLASLLDLLADEHVSREMQRLETPDRRRSLWPRPLTLAGGVLVGSWPRPLTFAGGVLASSLAVAAAVLILLVPVNRDRFDAATHRASATIASEAPVLTYPIGDVESATAFSWRSVRESDGYRLTLFDTLSHVLYERELADTALALPDSIVVVPRRPYLWMVEARIGRDRWLQSHVEEFRTSRSRVP